MVGRHRASIDHRCDYKKFVTKSCDAFDWKAIAIQRENQSFTGNFYSGAFTADEQQSRRNKKNRDVSDYMTAGGILQGTVTRRRRR